jgi:hypothetical protein
VQAGTLPKDKRINTVEIYSLLYGIIEHVLFVYVNYQLVRFSFAIMYGINIVKPFASV